VTTTVRNAMISSTGNKEQHAGFRSELTSHTQAISVAKAGALLRAGLCAGDRLRRSNFPIHEGYRFRQITFFALHRDLDGLNSSSHHANISHLEESAQSLPEPSRVAKDWDEFFMVNFFQCLEAKIVLNF
jgi:hypothetical protein